MSLIDFGLNDSFVFNWLKSIVIDDRDCRDGLSLIIFGLNDSFVFNWLKLINLWQRFNLKLQSEFSITSDFTQRKKTKIGPELYKNSNGFSNSPDGAIVWALTFALAKVKRVAPAGIAFPENAERFASKKRQKAFLYSMNSLVKYYVFWWSDFWYNWLFLR